MRVYREPQPEQGYQEQALGQGWQEPARNEAYQESLLAAQDYIASGIWGDAQGGDEQLPAPPASLGVLN